MKDNRKTNLAISLVNTSCNRTSNQKQRGSNKKGTRTTRSTRDGERPQKQTEKLDLGSGQPYCQRTQATTHGWSADELWKKGRTSSITRMTSRSIPRDEGDELMDTAAGRSKKQIRRLDWITRMAALLASKPTEAGLALERGSITKRNGAKQGGGRARSRRDDQLRGRTPAETVSGVESASWTSRKLRLTAQVAARGV